MAARQVLQAAADQDATALPRLIGIGEIHVLFCQERAQMSVDFLQRGVFERFIRTASGLYLLDLVWHGPVLVDLDAGELFQDPALRHVVCELGLFRLEAFIHCHDAFELFDIGVRVERHPLNQC
jgi:hypothetical protein